MIIIVIGILYVLERVFWLYATVNFHRAVQAWPVVHDYSVLAQAGQMKGIAALLGGLIGGFAFTISITIFFFAIHNIYGQIGGLIVIVTMLVAVPAKVIFSGHPESSLLMTFMTSMVLKNFGITLMAIGLFAEAFKS